MVKTRGEKILDALTSTCKAISPSEQFAYTGNGNYGIFPDKQNKPKEQTIEVDIRTRADSSTPTKIEHLRDSGNPYSME